MAVLFDRAGRRGRGPVAAAGTALAWIRDPRARPRPPEARVVAGTVRALGTRGSARGARRVGRRRTAAGRSPPLPRRAAGARAVAHAAPGDLHPPLDGDRSLLASARTRAAGASWVRRWDGAGMRGARCSRALDARARRRSRWARSPTSACVVGGERRRPRDRAPARRSSGRACSTTRTTDVLDARGGLDVLVKLGDERVTPARIAPATRSGSPVLSAAAVFATARLARDRPGPAAPPSRPPSPALTDESWRTRLAAVEILAPS